MNSKLPEGWIQTSVGTVAKYINGLAFKPSDWKSEGRPIIRIQNLTDPSRPFNRTPREFDDQFVVRPGEILVSWSATLDAFRWRGPEAILNQHIFRVIPERELVNEAYLFWALKRIANEMWDSAHTHGSTMKHINRGPFLAHAFPLPPLAEQRRIVEGVEATLGKVNSAKARLDGVPLMLKRFRQAVLAAACTGDLTREWRATSVSQSSDGVFPTTWRTLPIAEIASPEPRSIQSGPFGSSLLHSEFKSAGCLVIGIDNVGHGRFLSGKQHRITESKFRELEKYRARPCDVLVTVMGTVGRCCVIPEDIEPAIITKHVYRITTNHSVMLPRFLLHVLQGSTQVVEQITDQIRGQTRPGINGEILKSLRVPVPPVSEQREIVNRVDQLFAFAERIELRVQSATDRADKLQHAILSKAFSGELVPTEANLARAERRTYETAEELLARVKQVDQPRAVTRAAKNRRPPES